MQFIRPETKFSSIDALKAQVALDIEKVKGLS
jgi:FAD synthase